MTLTYAVIADGAIVLAADSEVTYPHEATRDDYGPPYLQATYQSKKNKIQRLKNGSAFSVSGNAGLVDALLKKADLKPIDDSESFEDVVHQYSSLFEEEYSKCYGEDDGNNPHCAFLFCGYIGGNERKLPMIYKLASYSLFHSHPQSEFAFTGRENHGAALYLHHRLHTRNLPTDSAKCLAYCVLSEVADMDNAVGRPIEMALVKASGAEKVHPLEFDKYESKRKLINEAMRTLIYPKGR